PGGEFPPADPLALYTTAAAHALHRETELGSLEVGKRADFVVLDGNPLTTDPVALPGLRVLAHALARPPGPQAPPPLPPWRQRAPAPPSHTSPAGPATAHEILTRCRGTADAPSTWAWARVAASGRTGAARSSTR